MAKKKSEKKQTTDSSTLITIREQLRKEFGEDAIRTYTKAKRHPVVSSGILSLDNALGGGIPEGRMTEIYGDNSSGKTTIILSTIAQAQKKNPDMTAVYIDVENTLNLIWAEKVGINLAKFDHIIPEFGEDAIHMMEVYLKTGVCSVIALDSVAAILAKAEADNDIGEANIGVQARLISTTMRRMSSMLQKYPKTVLFFVNQKRARIGGGPTSFAFEASKTTGGKSLPFYMTTRLNVVKTKIFKNEADAIVGQLVRTDVVKNKVNAGPWGRALFRIDNSLGVDTAHELLEAAIKEKIVTKSSSWYEFEDGEKAQGGERAKEIIREKYFTDWWNKYHVSEET
jgi:recombination protein RecA